LGKTAGAQAKPSTRELGQPNRLPSGRRTKSCRGFESSLQRLPRPGEVLGERQRRSDVHGKRRETTAKRQIIGRIRSTARRPNILPGFIAGDPERAF
jgi:hypothetical protein